MIGIVINKKGYPYIRYVQQHDGYVINTYEIEIDPNDRKLNLKEGQAVEFYMAYGRYSDSKNYARIKKQTDYGKNAE